MVVGRICWSFGDSARVGLVATSQCIRVYECRFGAFGRLRLSWRRMGVLFLEHCVRYSEYGKPDEERLKIAAPLHGGVPFSFLQKMRYSIEVR